MQRRGRGSTSGLRQYDATMYVFMSITFVSGLVGAFTGSPAVGSGFVLAAIAFFVGHRVMIRRRAALDGEGIDET